MAAERRRAQGDGWAAAGAGRRLGGSGRREAGGGGGRPAERVGAAADGLVALGRRRAATGVGVTVGK
jgi:hypothetical protein